MRVLEGALERQSVRPSSISKPWTLLDKRSDASQVDGVAITCGDYDKLADGGSDLWTLARLRAHIDTRGLL